MNALGRHVVVEFYECSSEILNDVYHIEKSMVEAAQKAGSTVINSTFHHFSPIGVSGVVVIEESHLSIHTWPEYGFASIDIFTCGDNINPWVAYNYLEKSLKAKHGSAIEMHRGTVDLLEKIEIKSKNKKYEKTKKPTKYTRNIWFTERDENVAYSFRHSGDPLFRKQSKYQQVEVFDTLAYGRMLTLDRKVMTTEKDEYVYHEMIAHVPMIVHPNPERVLVIGGGDGGAIREVLKHKSVNEVVMVEIDDVVIEACKKYLKTISTEFNNPKLDLKVEDGIKYVNNSVDESFDIVLVDSTDPLGPSEGLFTKDFYKQVYRILKKDGILVTQSESPHFNNKIFKEIFKCYKEIFGKSNVFCYLAFIPTYPSGMWSFSFSSKGKVHPLNDFDMQKAKKFVKNHKLRYYNENIHKSSFILPNFVEESLKEK